jgi:hypothetical protein
MGLWQEIGKYLWKNYDFELVDVVVFFETRAHIRASRRYIFMEKHMIVLCTHF